MSSELLGLISIVAIVLIFAVVFAKRRNNEIDDDEMDL
jgi:hypothetical protein